MSAVSDADRRKMSVRRLHVPGLKGRTDWLYLSDNVPTKSGSSKWSDELPLGLREEFDSRSDDDSPRAACALDALVLFFPGDIQTETRFLIGGPYADCVAWSYDRTLALLQDKARRRWANPGVVLVAPTRLVSYRAEYDHIVRRYGTAVRHLAALLDAVGLPADLPLLLVGFSRGVLVLNAVLAEIATVYADADADDHAALAYDWTADEDRAELPEQEVVPRKGTPLTVAELRQHAATIQAFCARIVAIHFVDGHRFPTNPQLEPGLRRFLQLQRDRGRPVAIVVHGTPRQLHCQRRPHIRSEHDRFMSLLAGLVRPSLAQSAPPALSCAADVAVAHHARGRSVDDATVYVSQRMYLADLPPSLHSHFRCLDEFEL